MWEACGHGYTRAHKQVALHYRMITTQELDPFYNTSIRVFAMLVLTSTHKFHARFDRQGHISANVLHSNDSNTGH